MPKILLKQGAEARVYETLFFGKPAILKERLVKTYRHPTLDAKLTDRRITQEVRCISRCRKAGLDVPVIYSVNASDRTICMERVDGLSMKDHLVGGLDRTLALEYCHKLGKTLGTMHNNDIIHGDLTTSNMLVRESKKSMVLIDFGLSFVSNMAEDKAVDLYVLQKAMLSTHANSEDLFEEIVSGYRTTAKQASETLNRLEQVRLRGRKRSMLG
eukprot:TRINITY_DN6103_c0_g1_i2.p1 TRINITY_DN6103_c0_g1~~TRINITY_DN6103_c0_g1_i2.p1  ORF type:complete len:214 (+),score=49.14 TRINITY_DN6103_c0_g1_i2:47-688(+)